MMIRVGKLFDVIYGANLEFNKMTVIKNGIPFVSRTASNNGVVDYVRKIKGCTPNPSHTISVLEAALSLKVFIKKKNITAVEFVQLKPKIKLTKNRCYITV